MKKPFFSIVVPFYNKEKSLDICLRSLVAQDFPKDNYEIVAVNNNSTDASYSIIENYQNIRLIEEKEQGAYAARNTGIRHAQGSFIVFTDADAQAHPTWLSSIYRCLIVNDYDILIGWYLPARTIRLLQIHSLLIGKRIKKALEEEKYSMLTACAANLIIKKELFEKERLFLTDSISEDAHFVMRCAKKNYRIGFNDAITIKRHDIAALDIFLLKNLLYGCSNALNEKYESPLSVKLKYMSLTLSLAFKHFPAGLGLFLTATTYLFGYAVTKYRIVPPKNIPVLISKCSQLISRKEKARLLSLTN